jgi:hypothetical protein
MAFFSTDYGVDIVTQKNLPTNIFNPSVLQIHSTTDTNDEVIHITTKILYLTNRIDGTNQLIMKGFL